MTDIRTLRLVGGAVEAAELEQYIAYQRALLEALKRHPVTDWPGRLAFSHSEAMRATGFDEQKLQRMRATVSQFCGRAWAVGQLERRREEASRNVADAKARGVPVPAKDEELLARIAKESAKVKDFSDFVARYGEETYSLLKAHQTTLVELHAALAHSEGKGHLHLA